MNVRNNAHLAPRFEDVFSRAGGVSFLQLINDNGVVLTESGACALAEALKLAKLHGNNGSNVLIPAFHCPTGVDPAFELGLSVEFYRIGRNLRFNEDELASRINETTLAVIIINYFGFEQDIGYVLERARQCGCLVIEDCAHSFVKGVPARLTGMRADIAIYSFWKQVPSLVGGGFVVSNKKILTDRVDVYGWSIWREARVVKKLMDSVFYNSRSWFFRSLAKVLDSVLSQANWVKEVWRVSKPKPALASDVGCVVVESRRCARIPYISKYLLHRAGLDRIVSDRRTKYNLYAGEIISNGTISVPLADLPSEVSPWVCPVFIRDRNSHDEVLKAMGVELHTFGLVLHKAVYESRDAKLIEDAQYLSDNLACLSIHKNISAGDVVRNIRIINDYFSGAK